MTNYSSILEKLEAFTKKYYTKMLLKGVLLFLSFGLFYFLLTLGIEYFLWLNSLGRGVLLILFIGVSFYLLYRHILVPLFYLFKLKKGISDKQASLLVGKHFPGVDDKLFNLLDLAEDNNQSELLLASIEQRSESLHLFEFKNAVDFKENRKYLKYLFIPLVIFGLIWLSGNLSSFFSSYERVVHYDLAYEAPTPFSFKLLDSDLNVLENKQHTIEVVTEGKIKPEQLYINVDGRLFLLQYSNGSYHYTFEPPLKTIDFYFEANDVQSRSYTLNALKTPSILDFSVTLNYPSYVNKKTVILNGTGNASFPEGTKVTWKMNTQNTNKIQLIEKTQTVGFNKVNDNFSLSKNIYNDYSYELSTSNENTQNHEKLAYQFNVIKDAYPKIEVIKKQDSLQPNILFFSGESSDDYLIQSIKLICYPKNNIEKKQTISIYKGGSNFEQFYYTFPSGLNLTPDIAYSFYFEVKDNDAIHNGKISKSAVFSFDLFDDNELINNNLEQQKAIIQNMDNSFNAFKEQTEELKELNQNQKEKSELSFQDKSKLKDFLARQEQQENMMEKFKEQFKKSLDKDQSKNELDAMLQERMERQEIEAKKNEKLLNELKEIADKIDKDELSKRLEELAKNQNKNARSLEQILELTKRYYVTEKAGQLARELEELAKKQELLSEDNNDALETKKQDSLNQNFNFISDELNELKEDNEKLKKPLTLPISKPKQDSIKEDQKDALEELNKEKKEEHSSGSENNEASKKQKSAAQKMQKMSDQLQKGSSSAGGSESEEAEDAEMLRQILDNLITFSFQQEYLYDKMQEADGDETSFSNKIKTQQELREMFGHVDDSLFSLSLRKAELSEFVNEQITEVYYNIDKALEHISENRMQQSIGSQQYVLTASNSLADFLADVLENMQQSMTSGSGQGKGEQGFQLPDIIKAQGELGEKMKGESGKPSGGKEGKQPGSEGESGEGGKGEKGESGNSGESGQSGSQGKNGQGDGNEGKNGQNGQSSNSGMSEGELKEIYEIYKQQQIIRSELEKQLQDIIIAQDRNLAQKLILQMEDFENDLLNNGITERTKTKVNRIQQQLLKLENAALKQGEENKRESNTNRGSYNNPILTKPDTFKDSKDEIEILNRQALPLQNNFLNKVKSYFIEGN